MQNEALNFMDTSNYDNFMLCMRISSSITNMNKETQKKIHATQIRQTVGKEDISWKGRYEII